MDSLNIVLTVLSIIIPVFATIYTVNSRIKNENRERHMPYIVLDKIEAIDEIDETSYFLTPLGNNYKEFNPNYAIDQIDHDNDLNVKLWLKNIGYGVSTNVRFYDLTTGKRVMGTQISDKEKNQKLFTTYDIASGDTNKVQTKIMYHIDNKSKKDDYVRMLCVYKDLNENYYDFIINISVKESGCYDYFAYQRTSRSYIKLIGQYNKYHKQIMKEYLDK